LASVVESSPSYPGTYWSFVLIFYFNLLLTNRKDAFLFLKLKRD
jgi:hypothetical protein